MDNLIYSWIILFLKPDCLSRSISMSTSSAEDIKIMAYQLKHGNSRRG